MPLNMGVLSLTFVICEHPLPHHTKYQASANLDHSQLAKKNRNYHQSNASLREIPGKGCDWVSPSSMHLAWTYT